MQEKDTRFGIYRITNSVDGTIYIGSTVASFHARWWRHRWHLNRGDHQNPWLQRAWLAHGADAFVFEVVEVITNKADVATREQNWLTEAMRDERCYNLASHTHRPPAFSELPPNVQARKGEKHRAVWLGRKHTPETKAKMSAAAMGHVVDEATKARMSRGQRQRVYTPELRAAMSAHATALHTGRKDGPETIAKRTAAVKAAWQRKSIRDGQPRLPSL